MKTLIQTPAGNLNDSLDFYSRLDFTILSDSDPVIVSDGKAFIEINPDPYARAGLKLFSSSWKETVEKLKQLTAVIETEDGYLLADTSGVWIYLVEKADEFGFEISESSGSALGNYVGISLETPAIEKSAEIWTALGFLRDDETWPAYKNSDGVTVTLYQPNSCPHLFFNPSLTYFNGKDNLRVIEHVRKVNIPITEEITHFNENGIVDNIVIRDPAGLGFLLFND
ncbi:MAG: hypothetical protein WEA56_11595 [Balneolaceae bacterium]